MLQKVNYLIVKDEEQLIENMKIEEEKSAPSENTAKNIEETKKKIAKDVSETYMEKNEEMIEKKEKKEKKEKQKARKVVPHLPAREWAIIYRNLKPLLRPCGDLGESSLFLEI